MSWLKKIKHGATASNPQATLTFDNQHTAMHNEILFQTFEWHTSSQPPAPNETHSSTSHYARLSQVLPSLARLGVTSVWLPPGCKANNPQGNGYDCYDVWDLGEFDQKYTRSTKWGSREELQDLMELAHRECVECVWDAVLNHKTAGDATDEAWAVEVDKEDRRVEICAPKKIEAWLKYDFPGREREGMKYSKMKWRAEHFNGTDWDQRAQKNAIYKLIDDPAKYPKPFQQQAMSNSGMNRLARLANKVASPPPRRPGKGWAEDVDDMHGNFDYLMFSNIDYKHPEVREDVLRWGEWMVNDVGLDGFRLDAVQHFSFAFSRDWIAHVRDVSMRRRNKPAFVVGEIWTGEVERITKWLDVVGQETYAYDSPLLYNFSRISEDVRVGSKNADLRTILRDSLVLLRPKSAVTLVTNHDTQPGQTSYTPIESRLKALFYAFILLRVDGYPCVFWGDVYGTHGPKAEAPACLISNGNGGSRSLIPDLMLLRKLYAYGQQKDYFDAMSCIGWTRAGLSAKPGSGCVVIMSIGSSTSPVSTAGTAKGLADKRDNGNWTVKKMAAGSPGEVWIDILANEGERPEVTIDAKGNGLFPCKGMGVGVFIRKDAEGIDRFPVHFDTGTYQL